MNTLPVSAGRAKSNGFTLIEVLVVIAIVGILATVAVPSFTRMIAEQRVRSAASDIMGDLVTARVEAIKQQRRVVMQRTGATWKEGWRIFVDGNADGVLSAGEPVIKTFNGYGASTSTVLPISADFANTIVFRGDGTVLNVPIGAETGLQVADTAALHPRSVVLSPAGRATVEILP